MYYKVGRSAVDTADALSTMPGGPVSRAPRAGRPSSTLRWSLQLVSLSLVSFTLSFKGMWRHTLSRARIPGLNATVFAKETWITPPSPRFCLGTPQQIQQRLHLATPPPNVAGGELGVLQESQNVRNVPK